MWLRTDGLTTPKLLMYLSIEFFRNMLVCWTHHQASVDTESGRGNAHNKSVHNHHSHIACHLALTSRASAPSFQLIPCFSQSSQQSWCVITSFSNKDHLSHPRPGLLPRLRRVLQVPAGPTITKDIIASDLYTLLLRGRVRK
jgi:hypothetical protein